MGAALRSVSNVQNAGADGAGEMTLLTGPDGSHSLSQSQRQMMALTSDHRLFVARDHLTHHYVLSFMARLAHEEIKYEVVESSIEEIARLYADELGISSQSTALDAEKLNLMQGVALESIRKAVKSRASDIHIHVNESNTVVKCRVDGELEVVHEDSFDWGNTLSHAIYQGMTDVSAPHFTPSIPLDAQIRKKVQLPNEITSIRVSTLPRDVHYAMFLRLFWRQFSEATSLEGLGYLKQQAEQIEKLSLSSHGMVIVAGPTGSGKTTTIHVQLNALNQRFGGRKSIVTTEDPVELPLPGQVQTSVQAIMDSDRETAYVKFATAAMRTDPDIFYMSEIRDKASGALALQGSLTGHLVFTTTHANTGWSVVPRLHIMGMDTMQLLDHQILRGIIAQRLVKSVCPSCAIGSDQAMQRHPAEDVRRMMKFFSSSNFRFRGTGCKDCDGRGTRGRTVIAEVIPLDATLLHVMRRGQHQLAEQIWRRRGNLSMRDVAIQKVKEGHLDPFDAELEVNGFEGQLDLVDYGEIDEAEMQQRKNTPGTR